MNTIDITNKNVELCVVAGQWLRNIKRQQEL